MDWLRERARRLRMLIHRQRFDADLEEEMRLHLELRQEEQLQSGMTADEARSAARVPKSEECGSRRKTFTWDPLSSTRKSGWRPAVLIRIWRKRSARSGMPERMVWHASGLAEAASTS